MAATRFSERYIGAYGLELATDSFSIVVIAQESGKTATGPPEREQIGGVCRRAASALEHVVDFGFAVLAGKLLDEEAEIIGRRTDGENLKVADGHRREGPP